jgi:hypothetical protein
MTILYAEGATKWMEDLSKDILDLLSTVYPNHPWGVHVYGDNKGGGYFIRHLDFPKNWGYNQPRAHFFASASELRADVIKGGGEILERSYLARAKWNEESIKKMDGVPLKDQPIEHQRQVQQEKQKETNDRLFEIIARSV